MIEQVLGVTLRELLYLCGRGYIVAGAITVCAVKCTDPWCAAWQRMVMADPKPAPKCKRMEHVVRPGMVNGLRCPN